jgi:L-aspartate oxidase
MDSQPSKSDVLVIGAGLAGLTAALHLADCGKRVTVLNRSFDAEESNTRYAQGGIIWWGEDDSPELLGHDIDQAGDEVGSETAIRILATEGGYLVESLLIRRLGIPFDRDIHGDIHRTSEAAHSRRRIIHVTDQTGAAIQRALVDEVRRQPNITIVTGATAIELISSTHHSKKRGSVYGPTKILGAYVLDRKSGAVTAVLASYTVVASGGLGAIYQYTTNPEGARGDGIALTERAGAHVINMEYVQFHPTAFRRSGYPSFLVSESVRGEGGVLLNQKRERFMAKYRPDVLELAPRDEVARAIWSEMQSERSSHVWLDCRPIAAHGIDLEKRFPGIFAKCLSYGVDIRKEPIPVGPAAHYLCGGIRVDEWGRTNLRNLYAVGEVSCTGLHGANRLGSTSLEEGLVWGRRAAENIVGTFCQEDLDDWQIPDWDESLVTEPYSQAAVAEKVTRVREMMWESAGIIRTEDGLTQGWESLSMMRIEVERIYRRAKLSDELVGLRNMVGCGLLVIEQARRNRQSRGCHYRGDMQLEAVPERTL